MCTPFRNDCKVPQPIWAKDAVWEDEAVVHNRWMGCRPSGFNCTIKRFVQLIKSHGIARIFTALNCVFIGLNYHNLETICMEHYLRGFVEYGAALSKPLVSFCARVMNCPKLLIFLCCQIVSKFGQSTAVILPHRFSCHDVITPRDPSQYTDGLSRCGNSHYNDKTVSWQSYIYSGNHHTWKDRFYIEAGAVFRFNIRHKDGKRWTMHYCDAIMGTIASQITSLTIVYTTVYSDADQSKHQSSASLAFVWGIHRNRWIPRTKGQLRGKCFHLMTSSWLPICYPCCVWIAIYS